MTGTIAVASDVKNQNELNQKDKDTSHTGMTHNVKTGKQMHQSDCAYLQAYQGIYLLVNTSYLYKELIRE